jgi:hypothetical protein
MFSRKTKSQERRTGALIVVKHDNLKKKNGFDVFLQDEKPRKTYGGVDRRQTRQPEEEKSL